jgi:nucleoside-triphosphatase THEP1
VFVDHNVIIAHVHTSSCNDCVNISQSLNPRMIACVNRSQRQSLHVSIIHVFNEPPLRVREGGMRVGFCRERAKREGRSTAARDRAAWEEAHAA